MKDKTKSPFDSKDFFKFETAHFFMLTQLFPYEPDRIKVFNALKDIAEVSKANHKDSHAFMNDEMLIFGKSLGFLRSKYSLKEEYPYYLKQHNRRLEDFRKPFHLPLCYSDWLAPHI